jgi:hypothetical protein
VERAVGLVAGSGLLESSGGMLAWMVAVVRGRLAGVDVID